MSLEGDEHLISKSFDQKTKDFVQSEVRADRQNPIFQRVKSKKALFQNNESNSEDKTSKHQQEQALLSAIYNTIAVSIFFACLGLLAILFIVLRAFLKPIFWALLTSAFLFSSKRHLTNIARSRLASIEKREAVLALESILFPFELLDSGIDFFCSFFKKNIFRLIGLILTVVFFNIIDSYYDDVIQILYFFIDSIYKVRLF